MKLLGFLFLVVVALGLLGWARGWFVVAAASTPGHTAVQWTIDEASIGQDARAVATGIAAAKVAATAPRSKLGHIAALDAASRTLTLQGAVERTVHRLPPDVPISRDGTALTFLDLRTDQRVRLDFAAEPAGDLRGVVVLP